MVRELGWAALAALIIAGPVAAQEPADTLPADTIPRESNAPRNAMLKSLAVPGLGQYSMGMPGRGTFWLAVRGSSYFMLVKTLNKLSEAKDRHGAYRFARTQIIQDSMAVDTAFARRMQDPESFDQVLLADTLVSDAQALVRSRRRHRQDWITYTIFFTFLDGLDAYVAAHLRDFPGEISTTPGMDGSLTLRVDMPITGRRSR